MNNQINSEVIEEYFDINLQDDYIKNHLEELYYCYEHKKSIIDFDWWTHVADLLGIKISYEIYVFIDKYYDSDLMELCEKDIPALTEILNSETNTISADIVIQNEIENLKETLTNVINESESNDLTLERMNELDVLYFDIDYKINYLSEALQLKV